VTDAENWDAAGRQLLEKVLELARVGRLPRLPVYRPEHIRGETIMKPVGKEIFLVADERRIETSPGVEVAVYGVAVSDTLNSLVRGRIEWLRSYREGPFGIVGRQRQSVSRSEFQPRSPGSRRQQRFPTQVFAIGLDARQPIESLQAIFAREQGARRHPELAALAGVEVLSFYLPRPADDLAEW
jgi:hypothetical protein